MSGEYKKVPTSAEVWSVIKARHHAELVVFGTYSAPEGDRFGNKSQAVMMTEYGFKNADWPLMCARTTWDVGDKSYPRESEKHEYWLCATKENSR